MDKKKLKVVFCWHMHQPEYRDLQAGTFTLPWTRRFSDVESSDHCPAMAWKDIQSKITTEEVNFMDRKGCSVFIMGFPLYSKFF